MPPPVISGDFHTEVWSASNLGEPYDLTVHENLDAVHLSVVYYKAQPENRNRPKTGPTLESPVGYSRGATCTRR